MQEKKILTNTLINTYLACPRKYRFRYMDGLLPTGRSQARDTGQIIHTCLEYWYESQPEWSCLEQVIERHYEKLLYDPAEIESYVRQEQAVVKAMIYGYINHYKDDLANIRIHATEWEFRLPVRQPKMRWKHKTFDLAGKADAIVVEHDLYWIMEHKTTSDISDRYFSKLAIDPQISLYIYAARKLGEMDIAGVIYNVIRKPSKRLKKNQTVEEYEEELKQDYLARPEFYFRREYAYRNESELRELEERLWFIAQQIRHAKFFPRNAPLACSMYGSCPYLPLCIEFGEELSESMYEKTDDLHPELSPEIKGTEDEGRGHEEELPW